MFYRENYDPEDMVDDFDHDFFEPYCDCCNRPCQPIQIDEGLGMVEFWGQWSKDVQLVTVSDCCEEPVREAKEDEQLAPPSSQLLCANH